MKIGLNFGVDLYRYKHGDALAIARYAEDLGYDSVWAGEHLILPAVVPPRPTTSDSNPRVMSRGARRGFTAEAPMLDVFVLFSHMAAVTTRLRFGTEIFVLPLRHPMATARAVATLDVLSDGRVFLGTGLGWMPDEFDRVGVNFKTRARRNDECIEILRALWTEHEPAFEGRFYSFDPVRFEPKPRQKGGPPIMIGGESEAAMQRAARLGDGWCARVHTPSSITEHAQRLQAMRREHGREHLPFQICSWLPREGTAEDVATLEQTGVLDHVIISMHGITDLDVALAEMRQFAERIPLSR